MTPSDDLVRKLLELDEDTLKVQLGIRVQEIQQDPMARSASLESLEEDITATPRGLVLDRDALKLGDSFFQELNAQSYKLMCGELFDDPELKAKIWAIYQENSEKAVELLSPILVSQFNLAGSLAVLGATLIIKTLCSVASAIGSGAANIICQSWETKLVKEKG